MNDTMQNVKIEKTGLDTSGTALVNNVLKQNFRFLNRRVVLTNSFVNTARHMVHRELLHLQNLNIQNDLPSNKTDKTNETNETNETITTNETIDTIETTTSNMLIPAVEFGTKCALLVSTRVDNSDTSVSFLELIHTLNTKSSVANFISMNVLCSNFTETIRASIICHKDKVRNTFNNMIVAMVVQHCEQHPFNYKNSSENSDLLHHLTSMQCFDFLITKNWSKMKIYLTMMLNIAKRSSKARRYMLRVGYLGKLTDLFLNPGSVIRTMLTSSSSSEMKTNEGNGWWNVERKKKTLIDKKKCLNKNWKQGAELILLLIRSVGDGANENEDGDGDGNGNTQHRNIALDLDPASRECMTYIPLYRAIMNGLDKKKIPMVDVETVALTLIHVGFNQSTFIEPCSTFLCSLLDQSNYEKIHHVSVLILAWSNIKDNYTKERKQRLLFGKEEEEEELSEHSLELNDIEMTSGDAAVVSDTSTASTTSTTSTASTASTATTVIKPKKDGLFMIVHRYEAHTKFARVALECLLQIVRNDLTLESSVRERWNTSLAWVLPLLTKMYEEMERATAATIAVVLAALVAANSNNNNGTTADAKTTASTGSEDDDLARALALSLATMNPSTDAINTPKKSDVPLLPAPVTPVTPAMLPADGSMDQMKTMKQEWEDIGKWGDSGDDNDLSAMECELLLPPCPH